MPVRRGVPLRHASRPDSNHKAILEGLEQIGFLVIDTSKLGGFVDAVVKHPARPEIGVKLLEIKSKRGKMSEEQRKLKDEWEESIIETRDINDVLAVFGFL